MGLIEHVIEPVASADFSQRRFSTRRWKVWGGVTRQQILNDPASVVDDNGTGRLPDIGTLNNGMRLDRYEVVGIGAGIFEVVGFYSNVNYVQSVASSFQTVTTPVPYNVLGTTLAFGATPGSNTFAWEVRQLSLYQTVTRFNVSTFFRFAGNSFTLLQNPIAARVNELHQFSEGGRYYRFEGADIQLVGQRQGNESTINNSDSFYEIRYSWVNESGVSAFTSASTDAPPLPNPPNPAWVQLPPPSISQLDGNPYTLPPFETLIPYRVTPDSTTPYLFQSVLMFRVVRDGWRSLPGMNP